MWEEIQVSVISSLIVAVALAAIALAFRSVRRLIPRIGNWIGRHLPFIGHYFKLKRHVENNRPLYGFRKFRKPRKPDWFPSTICIMNFKGGVGKTTITANLAAALSKHKRLRVLLVDLDYQGSLTYLLQGANFDKKHHNLAGRWISENNSGTPNFYVDKTIEFTDNRGEFRWVSSDYPLVGIEENRLQRWLLQMPTNGDVRSQFVRLLSREEFGDRFDIVLFDAPPRLSLTAVNALVASKYLLIPTRLEPLSVQPVRRMLSSLTELRKQIGADFHVAGAICNMTHQSEGAVGGEQPALTTLNEALVGQPGEPTVFTPFIRHAPTIGRPMGASVAYLQQGPNGDEARDLFNRLADSICARIGLVARPPSTQ